MHPFSVLTLGIFVAGYITARWDLVTRLYELAIFAAENGVVVSLLADLLHSPTLLILVGISLDACCSWSCRLERPLPRRLCTGCLACEKRNLSGIFHELKHYSW